MIVDRLGRAVYCSNLPAGIDTPFQSSRRRTSVAGGRPHRMPASSSTSPRGCPLPFEPATSAH
jgi:hypothetical protein